MHRELIGLLGETTLATSVALALVLLLRRPMRAAFGAGAAYALWWLVPVALIAVLLPAPVREVALVPMVTTVGAVQALASPSGESSFPWMLALLAAWMVGVLIMAGLQLWQQRRFLHRLGPLRAHAHGLRVAATSAGLPAVTGVLRPRIVLPADFLHRYDADERALVVAHERQHIARGDLPCNALVALLRCVYWFNPLLHWAVARYRHDQELACDARVIARHPHARRPYAQAMLKTQLDHLALPVGCHWHTHPIKERIAMLKRPSPRRWQTGLSSALLLALFCGGGYTAWAQQPSAKQPDAGNEVLRTQPAQVLGRAPEASHASSQQETVVFEGNVSIKSPGSKQSVDMLADRLTVLDPLDQGAQVEVRTPAPAYPKEAANAGTTGRVVVIVDVAPDGSSAAATIETSRPAGVFDAVVLKAVRGWKFAPAIKNGHAVAGRVRVPVDFDIDPPDETATQTGMRRSDYGWYRPRAGEQVPTEMACDVATAKQLDLGAKADIACGISKPRSDAVRLDNRNGTTESNRQALALGARDTNPKDSRH